jgi:CheY-like chemotaxis protein
MSKTATTVLLVEDDDDTRNMYAASLEMFGFNVRQARNGAEAVAIAPALKPHAILMDLAMPHMDGFEATRRLKSDPETAPIPIVVLTAFTSPADCERALGAGANDFLAKPCDPDAVAARLQHHVRRAAERGSFS